MRLARLRRQGVEIEGTPLIGRDVTIEIAGGGTLSLGDGSSLGDGVVLTDFTPNAGDVERATREQGLTAEPIAVGDAARVGHGACLLRAATVEPGGSVAPHAVVGNR